MGDRAEEGEGGGGAQPSEQEQMVKKNMGLFASLGVWFQYKMEVSQVSGVCSHTSTRGSVCVGVWVTPSMLEVLRPVGDSGCCLPSQAPDPGV